MNMLEIINNQYGEGSVKKVLEKCKTLHMTADGLRETLNMLCCIINDKDECFKNNLEKDLAHAIDYTCMLFDNYPDLQGKEMCTQYN